MESSGSQGGGVAHTGRPHAKQCHLGGRLEMWVSRKERGDWTLSAGQVEGGDPNMDICDRMVVCSNGMHLQDLLLNVPCGEAPRTEIQGVKSSE